MTNPIVEDHVAESPLQDNSVLTKESLESFAIRYNDMRIRYMSGGALSYDELKVLKDDKNGNDISLISPIILQMISSGEISYTESVYSTEEKAQVVESDDYLDTSDDEENDTVASHPTIKVG